MIYKLTTSKDPPSQDKKDSKVMASTQDKTTTQGATH